MPLAPPGVHLDIPYNACLYLQTNVCHWRTPWTIFTSLAIAIPSFTQATNHMLFVSSCSRPWRLDVPCQSALFRPWPTQCQEQWRHDKSPMSCGRVVFRWYNKCKQTFWEDRQRNGSRSGLHVFELVGLFCYVLRLDTCTWFSVDVSYVCGTYVYSTYTCWCLR